MTLWSRMQSWLRAVFQHQRAETEMDAEMRFHLDAYAEDLVRAGVPREEARRRARLEFGGVERAKEECRDARGVSFVDGFTRDLHFGLRMFRKNPGFTLTVVITLALAIGANTAIFSLVNALLLKNLPYAHPERLGTIYTRIVSAGTTDERHNLMGEQWELLRDNVPALLSAVTGGASGVNLQSASGVQYVQDARVSAHYFEVLALQPALGRNFSLDEDRPHSPKVAILSYNLWRTLFAADPNILGQSILLKGEPHTVIGVLPQGAVSPLNADVYTALQPSRDGEGSGSNFAVITRLRDGATWQEADAQINRTWSTREHRYELNDHRAAQVTYHSVPLQKGQTDSLRPQVLTLMLAAGFILLIACANLAGLTLVRMLRRTPEVATRLAIGASHWQIISQLWMESLLLALLGGAAGVAVGFLGLRGLLLLLPPDFLTLTSVPLDARVLFFSAGIAIFTSVLFGMLPALQLRKMDLRSSMLGRALNNAGNDMLRLGLITGEVALTVVLLCAAGLLIRSLVHLESLPPGFQGGGVMIAKASLDDARYHDPVAFRKLLDQSTAAMLQIPAVANAAVGLAVPYERTVNDGVTFSDGKAVGQTEPTDEIYVTPGYFDTLQMPILAGRAFSDADGPASQKVAIVNRTFAHKFYGGGNPVGHYIDRDIRIIGEVTDVPVSSGLYPDAPLMSEQTIYTPAAQLDPQSLALIHVWFQPDWIVRTSKPIAGLTAEMQRALNTADPNLPASGFYSMSDLLALTLTTQRLEVALLGAMAGLALMLSAVGIFALVANMVAQRTREIGIRMALGSTVGQAMLHVGRTGAAAAILGIVLGLALSSGALRLLRSFIYGIGVYDLPTLAAVVVALILVTLLATILPALRVSTIDPSITLRDE
ncbi:MAG TPA: ABC transporter permease [Verrucomicrobiae bacterium]|nr:ABC transporter permease [Verrucomicrobiae bacterium]